MNDVCLILEGTYPYVAGGVSTWIHQLVTSMSDMRFSIVNLSPFPDPRREAKYKIPPHVVEIKDLYLHSYQLEGILSPLEKRQEMLLQLKILHDRLIERDWEAIPDLIHLLRTHPNAPTIRDIFETKESWSILCDVYQKKANDVSFMNFFWTWRSIYMPLYHVLTSSLPKARLYHTVSTGYAGLIGAMAKLVHGSRLILTEHGIYTHERFLEISQASWIYTERQGRFKIETELPFFKRLWLGLFQTLGGVTYRYADQILTLYEGNKTREILDGADPEKVSIVPNGIDLEVYRKLQHKGPPSKKPVVAFIGRVVSIKDVKTFILAAKMVQKVRPEAEFLIIGPTDEETEYFQECQQLIESLRMTEQIKFTGKVNVLDMYPKVDVVVLTSLSEAQPYVILEANAVGVPCVSTDVGACRELLEGRGPQDSELGPSGLLTHVSSPEETAEAILKIVTDLPLWHQMSRSGKTRVNDYYDQYDLLSQYLNIYEKNMR